MQNGIVEAIDRLYRLTESIHNGTAYTVDNGQVVPAIPATPATPAGLSEGLRRQLLDMQGTLPAGWFGWGSQPATLADMVRAVRADTDAQVERVKSSFSALQTLAQGATVFDVVSGFLEEGAQITAEGGILATLIVSTMAQAAMMGAQAGQLDQLLAKLDRLIASLDGGGLTPPAGNVLGTLQSIDQVRQPAILAAVQAIQAGNSTAAINAIALALGTSADCVTGESVIGLLCRLNSYVGGVSAPTQPPPGVCPGFEGGISYGPVEFTNALYQGNPTPQWFAAFDMAPAVFGFQGETYPWQDTPQASNVTFWTKPGTEGSSLMVCIAIQETGASGGVHVDQFDPTTYEYVQECPVTPGSGYTGVHTATFTMMSGALYVLRTTNFGGNSPGVQAWITINPQG